MKTHDQLISDLQALSTRVRQLAPDAVRDPYVAQALGALHTARDHVRWHGEEQERLAKLAAENAVKAAAPTPGS